MSETDTPIYKQTDRPVAERADDLVGRMTLGEKIAQMKHGAEAIPRLDVPEYNWWGECLHGVARAGVATVFPQAIGMAASFNTELMYRVAVAISDEGRAKHHEFARRGDRGIYKGLTFWTPNINIFRDPRWGRGHETYGEDPYLTARMGVAFVKGLQGDDPRHLKSIATPKHYAVHSGPEPERHRFDAVVDARDLRETYLRAFKACVVEAGAFSIMGAYNRTNGEPCCASPTLLQKILRGEWGFEGYVVSDCGAICDLHQHHHVTDTPQASAALAVKNGCELNCGNVYPMLQVAVAQGLITEAEIDVAVKRLFTARFRLGLFDPPERVAWARIPYEVNDCPEHHALAREMARQSIVLLKNEDNVLPLSKDLRSVAVIGPNAASEDVLVANYFGTPSAPVTILEGVRRAVGPKTRVWYAMGCDLIDQEDNEWTGAADRQLSEGLAAAERADAVILCLGLSPRMEGEEGAVANSDGGGDRTQLDLQKGQQDLLEAVHALGKPMVLVLCNGSAVAVNWAKDNVPAIVEAWYPGGEGGAAVADVLFGDANPGGRLPVTFPKSMDQLPPFRDYNMRGHTYRFMEEEPLYRFGYGLSYTTFAYANLSLGGTEIGAGDSLDVRVDVANAGKRTGDEVVQVYVADIEASVPVPLHHLEAFARVTLEPGETKTVSFTLTEEAFQAYRDDGTPFVEPGDFRISVGAGQPTDPAMQTLSAVVRVR